MRYILLIITVLTLFSQEKTVTITEDHFSLWKDVFTLKYNDSTKNLSYAQKNRRVIPKDEFSEYQNMLDQYLARQTYQILRRQTRAIIDSIPFDSIIIRAQIGVLTDFRDSLKKRQANFINACDYYINYLNRLIFRQRLRERLTLNQVIQSGEKIRLLYRKGLLTVNRKDIEAAPYMDLIVQIFQKFNEEDRFQTRF